MHDLSGSRHEHDAADARPEPYIRGDLTVPGTHRDRGTRCRGFIGTGRPVGRRTRRTPHGGADSAPPPANLQVTRLRTGSGAVARSSRKPDAGALRLRTGCGAVAMNLQVTRCR